MALWYIFPRFGILCQEKSGNPMLPLTAKAIRAVGLDLTDAIYDFKNI
jgi:hypothetical protein